MFIFLDEFLVTFILTLKDHRAQKMLSPLKWLRVGRTCAPFLKTGNQNYNVNSHYCIIHYIFTVIINMILHLHNLSFIGQRMFYKIGIRSPFLGR